MSLDSRKKLCVSEGIPREEKQLVLMPIERDGNCFYKAVALCLVEEVSAHEMYREMVYDLLVSSLKYFC
jgi:hypothetical protein